MSVYLHYQAMPEGSRLFQRLLTEQALCMMYCELIHRPCGPFDWDRLESGELDGLLSSIARNPVFGSLPVVERVFADLRSELLAAEREYPGLRMRSAYLKANDYFDSDLANAFLRIGRDKGPDLTDRLVMGDGRLVEDGWGNGNVTLQLVPPQLVAEADALFARFAAGDMAEYGHDFIAFRQVYEEAARRNEAVLIA